MKILNRLNRPSFWIPLAVLLVTGLILGIVWTKPQRPIDLSAIKISFHKAAPRNVVSFIMDNDSKKKVRVEVLEIQTLRGDDWVLYTTPNTIAPRCDFELEIARPLVAAFGIRAPLPETTWRLKVIVTEESSRIHRFEAGLRNFATHFLSKVQGGKGSWFFNPFSDRFTYYDGPPREIFTEPMTGDAR